MAPTDQGATRRVCLETGAVVAGERVQQEVVRSGMATRIGDAEFCSNTLFSYRLLTMLVTIGAPYAVTVETRRPVSKPLNVQRDTRLLHYIMMNPTASNNVAICRPGKGQRAHGDGLVGEGAVLHIVCRR